MQKKPLDDQIEELERQKQENKAKIEALRKTIRQLKDKVTGQPIKNQIEKK